VNLFDFEHLALYNSFYQVGASPLFYCSELLTYILPLRIFKLFDLDRTKTIIERVVSSEGMELVDVELKGGPNNRILRIYIDKPSGVTHHDCELISDQVGTTLDVEDVISGSYTLEVSSPGLTRKLDKEADFRRSLGRLVKVQTKEPVDGAKGFRGTLVEIEGGTITVKLKNGHSVQIPLELITRANLDIEF
jgi:ribosome maturation factor RimP